MNQKDCQMIVQKISKITPYLRFVGVIGEKGELIAYYRRPDLKPLLNAKNTQYQFSNIAINTGLDAAFDKNLGEIEFVLGRKKKGSDYFVCNKKDQNLDVNRKKGSKV